MKRLNVIFFAAIIVAVGVLGYSSYQKKQKPALSELAMANVEALTQSEGGTSTEYNIRWHYCYNGKKTFGLSDPYGSLYTVCAEGTAPTIARVCTSNTIRLYSNSLRSEDLQQCFTYVK